MAMLINENKLVNDNIFQFENRLNSQISRFLDKNPVFVTYYHVNVNETTVDDGFRDIESIIGNRSPLRFQKIENFPMYGLESVVLSIQDAEQGLDTDYQGECVILPNTIKPLQNDFFVINHVKESFIFRVIEISYDSIRPDNYYKISFRFEYLDDTKMDELNNQVQEKYSCILENIGSENNCIIQEEYKLQLDALNDMYDDMCKTYISIFYNNRYNCFLGDDGNGYKFYDPLQTVFFNNHKLLNKKNDLSTLVLSEGFVDNQRKLKYEKSIYRFFERRDVKLMHEFPYNTYPAIYKKDSAFSRWNDQSILVVDIPSTMDFNKVTNLFTPELVTSFKVNAPQESKYVELMQKFIRKEDLTIYDIPTTLNEDILSLDTSDELFFFTPILLYIVKTIINDFLKEKK